MIEIFEGFGVGAGKSYLVVTRLINHFLNGGTAYVADTMCVDWDAVQKHARKRYGVILDPEQYHTFGEDGIKELYKHTPQGSADCPVVIVVDECQGRLNARDWADKEKRPLFDWACQSRHDDNDLWFISQSAENIDKQIRRLSTYMWRVRNTRNWGSNIITGALKVLRVVTFGVHPGAYFIVRQLDQNGRTTVGKLQFLDQDPEVFACYNSKAMRGRASRLSNEAVAKKQLQKVESSRPWVRWAVACAVLLVFISGCKVYKAMRGGSAASPEAKPQAGVSPSPGATPRPPFDVRVEAFRSQIGHRILGTDKWTYQQGLMCPDGMVELVGDGQVRVKQLDGRNLFVIADRRERVVPRPLADRTPEPRATPGIVVAPLPTPIVWQFGATWNKGDAGK